MVAILPVELQDKIFLYCDFNTLKKTRELQSKYIKDLTKFDNYTDAIRAKNLDCMKMLYRSGFDIPGSSIKELLKTGTLEMVIWFYEVDYHINYHFMELVACNPDVRVIDFLFNKLNVKLLAGNIFRNAVRCGNLEVVKWLHGHNCYIKLYNGFDTKFDKDTRRHIFYPSNDVKLAAFYGHIEIYKFLCNIHGVPENTIYYCGAYSNLDVLKYVYSLNGKICDVTFYEAVKSDDLEKIKWVYDKIIENDIEININCNSIFSHIKNGFTKNIEVLEWLVDQGLNFKTHTRFNFIDDIILRGNFDLVLWLRAQDCTFPENSFTLAAGSGNLEMMKWMFSSGFKVDEDNIFSCIKSGSIENLKWLLSVYKGKIKHKDLLFYDASACNNLEMLDFLYERYSVKQKFLSRKVLINFIEHCNLEAIKWIGENSIKLNCKVKIDPTNPRALEIFEYFSNSEAYYKMWLVASFAHDSPDPDLAILKRIHELGYTFNNIKPVAVKRFSLEILKFAHELDPKFDEQSFRSAFNYSASLKKLKWMYDNGCNIPDDELYDECEVGKIIKKIKET